MSINDIKQQIIEIGKKLYLKDLTSGTSGNISVRYGNDFLITASGTALADLVKEEIVQMDEHGNSMDVNYKPSSEKILHLAIYKKRPDINAIIHCHPAVSCAFAAAGLELEKPLISENILYFGKIPLAQYGMPSSIELVENTAKLFDEYDTVLMANHGIIVGEKDLKHAFYKTETAETYAKVCLYNKVLGKEQLLNEKQVEDLNSLRLALKS